MKAILSLIILVIAVVGGAVAGDFMKSRKTQAISDSVAADYAGDVSDKSDGSHKKSDKGGKGGKKDSKKGGHDDDSSKEGILYLKFKRQFVVPVLAGGSIDSLVIMNFNIELEQDAPENIYSYEPKLRDAIMRELLALSNTGIFGKDLTERDTYETVRLTLMKATKDVVPYGVKDILILDIARQDQ